jgi:peptidoglycan/LPS O-acetylase OafA/YrhL
MNQSNRNVYLDWVRGVSALIVCAGHTRNALLPDFADLPEHSLFVQLIYLVTGCGHAAVMVFFVLSGYLVGGSVLNSNGSFGWRKYLVNRYVRLWVVLLPALIWTWLVDQQTLALAPQVLLGGLKQNWHSVPVSGEYSTAFATFLLNLGFQQTVSAPVYGSNGPLWSLANEAWYYLLFPLLALPILDRRWWIIVSHWLLAALIIVCMPEDMLWLFPIWLMGVLLRKIPLGLLKRIYALRLLAVAVFFATLLAYKKFGQVFFIPHAWDLMIGLSFAFWVACLIAAPTSGGDGLFGRIAIRLSDFSYSLYLFHIPLVMWFGAVLSMPQRLPGRPKDFVVLAGCIAIELIVAYVFWWLFERRTNAVKQFVLRVAGPR